MNEMQAIGPLWRSLNAADEDYVLATIVAVEGSGYRKPGARMIVAPDGRRSGTISGGCLEAEVAQKAFWHTEHGPVMRSYSTHAEDGDVPYGMGCGGVVHVLLERRKTAEPLLQAMERAYRDRVALAVATCTRGEQIAARQWRVEGAAPAGTSPLHRSETLAALADAALLTRQSHAEENAFVEWMAPRTGLLIVGAGNDAQPLVRLAHELGWHVTVIDGRSHLATPERFPLADLVLPSNPASWRQLTLRPSDVAALMTHSLDQDTNALRYLLRHPPTLNPTQDSAHPELAYLGVLGPRARTAEIVEKLAAEAIPDNQNSAPQLAQHRLAQHWMNQLHAPMGLDLGGDGAAAVALSIVAEIQRTLQNHSGQPLREIRAKIQPTPAKALTLAR